MGWLKNQVALITGGTGGIGSAIVRRYVKEGAKVGVMARNLEELESLKNELGDEIHIIQGDVTIPEDNKRAVDETLEKFGKLDTFVANAGVYDYFTKLERIEPENLAEAFEKIFSVNVRGYLLGARYAIEPLRKTKGSMIFTLSNSSFYAGGGGILYVASKHALVGVVRQLALELAPDIRVNAVAPGATNTEMASAEGLNKNSVPLNQIPGFLEKAADAIPLKFLSEPEDHTGHYVLLASKENSKFTTANIIQSDGGWEIRMQR